MARPKPDLGDVWVHTRSPYRGRVRAVRDVVVRHELFAGMTGRRRREVVAGKDPGEPQ